MSEDYQTNAALMLLEIDRLHAEVEKAETARKAWTEIGAKAEADAVAERHARELAEARLYAYGDHQPHCPLYGGGRGVCTCGYSQVLERPPALLAELSAARQALEQIDRHVVGACESGLANFPEPCEECGEMREIAANALAAMKQARAE